MITSPVLEKVKTAKTVKQMQLHEAIHAGFPRMSAGTSASIHLREVVTAIGEKPPGPAATAAAAATRDLNQSRGCAVLLSYECTEWRKGSCNRALTEEQLPSQAPSTRALANMSNKHKEA
jgi:hypothetical protein